MLPCITAVIIVPSDAVRPIYGPANDLAADLENDAYGRDYAVGLAEQLVGLDLGV